MPSVRKLSFSSQYGAVSSAGFRQAGDDRAVVRLLPAGADAALHGEAAAQARVDRDVDAVPVLNLLAVVAGQRVVVVLRQAHLRRADVVEPADRVAAAVGQPRIGRRRDAERVEVGGRQVEVVGDAEVAVPAAEVADIHRDAPGDLPLHAGRELPLVGPRVPAVQHRGVVVQAGRRLAEVRVVTRRRTDRRRSAGDPAPADSSDRSPARSSAF